MVKKKPAFKPLAAAQSIIRKMKVHRLSLGSQAQLVTYDAKRGLYVLGDGFIRLEAQRIYGGGVLRWHVNETLDAVIRNAPFVSAEELNDPNKGIVIFQNGILEQQSLRLMAFSPNCYYSIGIPHNWNPVAVCPKFDLFMNQILLKETHNLVSQLIGYLLIPSTRYRKFFVFLGSGANGKSTLIRIMEAVLGSNNVCHESLHALGESRFAAAELYGKLANTYADLDSHDIKSAGLLKQIVSGDSLQFEKKYKDPFSAPVTARLVFSANKMPIIMDTSDAISDRLVLLEFPNRFDEDKQDKNLIDKLTTKGEIEGIIAKWAIPGLQSLLRMGKFDFPNCSRQLLVDYQRQSDPFRAFVQEEMVAASGKMLSKQELYDHYESWWERERLPHASQISKGEFNKRIADFFGIPNDDRRMPGTRVRCWEGIQLKSQASQPDPNPVPSRMVENIDPSQLSQLSTITSAKGDVEY